MADRRADAGSPPVKACLIAPTFLPTFSPRPQKQSGKASRKKSTASRKTRAGAGAADRKSERYSSVDDAVRRAYRKVRRERDLKRKKLVASALRESRDGVIDEVLREEEKNVRETYSGKFAVSGDTKRNDVQNEEQRHHAAAKRKAAESPRRKKFIIKFPTMMDVAEEKKNDSDDALCSDDGDEDGGLGPNGGRAPQPGESGGRAPQLQPSESGHPCSRTLVFPRLPSNGCASYQVFSPPLCQTCDEEGNLDNNKNAEKVVPPNLSNPNNDDHLDYTLAVKLRGQAAKTAMTSFHKPLLIEGAHPPRPRHSSLIFLRSSLAVDDEPGLAHVPYFGDGDTEDIYSVFDTKERERLYEFGPRYQEKETLDTVDEVLRLMAARTRRLSENDAKIVEGATTKPAAGVGAEKRAKAKELERIHLVLSELVDVDVERVHERHVSCFVTGDGEESSGLGSSRENEPNNGEKTVPSLKMNSDTPVAVPYESIMDSYRDLFCRKCFTYDCNIHGNLPKASIDLLGELAVQKELDGHWKELDKDIASDNISNKVKEEKGDANNVLTPAQQSICKCARLIFQGDTDKVAHAIGAMPLDKDIASNNISNKVKEEKGGANEVLTPAQQSICKCAHLIFQGDTDKVAHAIGAMPLDKEIASGNISNKVKEEKGDANDVLTPAQQSICKRAYLIFQGDTDKVAHAIGAMPAAVAAFVKSEKIELRPNKFVTQPLKPSSKRSGKRAYASMKNYNQRWLRRIQSRVILPAFLPCDHDGICNDDNCSCVANGFFCTKACGWGCRSPNFFRGCECRAGQCRSHHCPCYAASRECDPDLCRTCGSCADAPDAPATEQRCRNDGISMRRHCHLLVAESNIKEAGWGLFTKHALKKGDFVNEYVGEIISQEEAERRGVIYDKLNMSYLFNLSSDLVVDATRKGNKSRYANHSSTPNIEPKMIHVNGDMRIGFYAKHDIDAQSELFFDYRYDEQMDNELIFKPDHSVNFDWMNKNNQGRKKNS